MSGRALLLHLSRLKMSLSDSRLIPLGNTWLMAMIATGSWEMVTGADWATSALLFGLGVGPFVAIRVARFRAGS